MTEPSGRSASTGYDKRPRIRMPQGSTIWSGAAAWRQLDETARSRAGGGAPLILIDAYPGVDLAALTLELRARLPEYRVVDIEAEAAHSSEQIEALVAPYLTDDRVFGVMSQLTIDAFYDAGDVASTASAVNSRTDPTIVVGWGAARLPTERALVVLADLARWEIQARQRAGATNWRADNADDDPLRKYKRGFFVEWRAADRHKRDLFPFIDFVLDTNRGVTEARVITGAAFRDTMALATTAPFRPVPFFDPGVWGGQWMKTRFELEPSAPNYAWCFDCVPEENSLLLESDGHVVEVPAMDLVILHPRELLGEKTFARFGAEFPIRFDLLDTMGGGNLSLQVHPLTDYIHDVFGMDYTQDESYYLLDSGDDAKVYLGLKAGIDPDAMLAALRTATRGGEAFRTDDFVNSFPARKHDHFSIPAGTVHCSGADSMVLEISATPFIFTFKLWDWDRVGLDGLPRPVHLDHGAKNIQWDRTTEWVKENLIDQVTLVAEGDGVREERTGLHELEFIEVRRHWFEDEVRHDTGGTVNVLNLVEGDEVEVVSPTDSFPPFPVHYAETFIVPASVGEYVIRRSPHGTSDRYATVKAYVRGTLETDS